MNELWRENLFQLAITFHGGMESITYEWGSYNHHKVSQPSLPPSLPPPPFLPRDHLFYAVVTFHAYGHGMAWMHLKG